MTDCYSKEIRSRVMSKIRSKNTKPEVQLRKFLWNQGYRGYRIHNADLPGKPDIVFKKKKIAIFIDGCFWHKCPFDFREPKTNPEYWMKKIQSNVDRDKKVNEQLQSDGWKVVRVWEHMMRKEPEKIVAGILALMKE
ncbi:MAG: very short patch repair endonuclease [Methanoregula sp.]|nr:very short patch repair endonuclease [Methanoregula sp.]